MTSTVGIIAIGRNEGDRLRRCLTAAQSSTATIVYVDSGSTDGSAAMARAMDVEVVELDMSIPFTAARARNAGFERLIQLCPDVEFVQFVDGDSELATGWLATAEHFLRDHLDAGVAGGLVRERLPEASIYNRLCEIEWQTPIGETHWCGGNAMMRAAAFKEVGGFNPLFIAGEEPELCVRLREKGWKIHRLDADIATHDADMHRFGQWWRRAVRNGYSIAEGARTHGHRPERYWVREARRGWVWGLVLPVVALAAAWPTRGWSVVAAVCLYALLFMKVGSALRTALSRPGESVCSADSTPLGTRLTYALFIVLGKIPQALGQLRYWFGGSP